VARSIEFNSQTTFRTKKVDNVRTYAVLSSELLSVELRVLEVFPQKGLSRSEISTKFFAPAIGRCQVVNQAAVFHAERQCTNGSDWEPPVCARLRRLRGILLMGAATPPNLGGEYRQQQILVMPLRRT